MKPSNEFCINFLKASGWLDNHDKQIRADKLSEICKQISERVKYWDGCAKAVEKGTNEYKIFISLAKNFDELLEQLKEQI